MFETLPRLIATINRLAMKAYIAKGAYKTVDAFDRQLWRAALDFFRGGDAFSFIDDMTGSIDNQLARAWNEGARAVNFDPRDMSDSDLQVLDDIITSEHDHVLDLATAIDDARLSGATLNDFRLQFRSRIDLWTARYTDVVNQAKLYFGTQEKLEWVYSPEVEEHCDTCEALNGIVALAADWEESGYKPQSPPNEKLTCGGWRCLCRLEITDKPKTRGGIPNV